MLPRGLRIKKDVAGGLFLFGFAVGSPPFFSSALAAAAAAAVHYRREGELGEERVAKHTHSERER